MLEPHPIRCDHDGVEMAKVKDGHLILVQMHRGETHIKVVSLRELIEAAKVKA